jgi:hypothetical protein
MYSTVSENFPFQQVFIRSSGLTFGHDIVEAIWCRLLTSLKRQLEIVCKSYLGEYVLNRGNRRKILNECFKNKIRLLFKCALHVKLLIIKEHPQLRPVWRRHCTFRKTGKVQSALTPGYYNLKKILWL